MLCDGGQICMVRGTFCMSEHTLCFCASAVYAKEDEKKPLSQAHIIK